MWSRSTLAVGSTTTTPPPVLPQVIRPVSGKLMDRYYLVQKLDWTPRLLSYYELTVVVVVVVVVAVVVTVAVVGVGVDAVEFVVVLAVDFVGDWL